MLIDSGKRPWRTVDSPREMLRVKMEREAFLGATQYFMEHFPNSEPLHGALAGQGLMTYLDDDELFQRHSAEDKAKLKEQEEKGKRHSVTGAALDTYWAIQHELEAYLAKKKKD